MVKILSIDGGGIRGLIPALILRELEVQLRRKGKERPLGTAFDLMAGTSTGALITLGLALPDVSAAADPSVWRPALSVDRIVDLYERRGVEIFPPTSHVGWREAMQAIKNKYSGAGIEGVLAETFGDVTMRQGLTNLLVTSFDPEKMEPRCIKNRPPREEWADDLDFYMRDAARATTAAPTYFPPARIQPVPANGETCCLVDGALFANNPAMLAYVEATKIFPEEREFLILALGTGRDQVGYSYKDMRSWGYFGWVNPVKGVPLWAMFASGQNEATNHQLRRIPGLRYIRLNAAIDPRECPIDDASPKTIGVLRRIAGRIAADHRAELETVAELL
ncbi:MAG TPA: patatin-like phospholipase family protein [Rectinemataceae bacterium]|nr:patatin-like phospholipase family protein [Rectinemataceae bacterium]